LPGVDAGPPPDTVEARRRYGQLASRYDRHIRFVAPLRRRAVQRLKLQKGGHVLDMGCGTGASFGDLRSIVGATGRVTGVELSEQMAAVARRRVEDNGWTNVEVVVGDAGQAPLPSDVDGILFFETHDLMRTPAVVRRAVAAGRPGARVVAFGPASAPRWALPVNAIVRSVARRYVTTFEGFDAPWSHLAAEVPGLRVHRLFLGAAYLAIGITGTSPEVQ
jgi:demethylmenaquinone methyltransferase/2-methoxy-6-polyprenyl-1,4-benzoquinol methylase